jgi:hypothetical protein
MADEVKNLSSYTNIEGTEISYSRKDVLGRGNFTVYDGLFKGKKVAVKRIPLQVLDQQIEKDREVKNLLEVQHENVVRLYKTAADDDFRFIS